MYHFARQRLMTDFVQGMGIRMFECMLMFTDMCVCMHVCIHLKCEYLIISENKLFANKI